MARRGMTGATGNIYYGLHEFQEMAFLLHLLRPDDYFVDVGANVGSYTILASGVCGARSVSFEPDPGTFADLKANIDANRLSERVIAVNKAIGSETGELQFTVGLDSMNRVVRSEDKHGGPVQTVAVVTLDDALEVIAPTFMKVDVEGFEAAVINGAERTLVKPSLLALMLETVDARVLDILHRLGFARFTYDPFNRALSRVPDGQEGSNQLFVRDEALVTERLTKAESFRALGRLI